MFMALKSAVAIMSPLLIAAIAWGIALTPASSACRPAERSASITPIAMISFAARMASMRGSAASIPTMASRAGSGR